MHLLALVVGQAISQIDLHPSGLACLVPVLIEDNSVRDVLINLGLEELMEFSAFYLIVKLLTEN